MKNLNVILLLLVILSAGCNNDLKLLSKHLEGEFHNKHQSQRTYQHVSVKITPIWKKVPDHWFLVQQFIAQAGYAPVPYRERVYRLYNNDDGQHVFDVYRIDSTAVQPSLYPLSAETLSQSLSPGNLLQIEGCSFRFRKNGNYFKGETVGKDCLCYCLDAAYVHSEISIYENRLESRDQFMKANGTRVEQRAKKYVFRRQ